MKKLILLTIMIAATMTSQAYENCPDGLDMTNAIDHLCSPIGIASSAGLNLRAGAEWVSICEYNNRLVLRTIWSVIGEPGKTMETLELFSK